MGKDYFVVSTLFKDKIKNKKCTVLDNYIALNNPDFSDEELHVCPRNSKEDWQRYERALIEKHNKYFSILSERLNYLNNVQYSNRYWQQLFYLGLKRHIALVYEFFNQVESRFDSNRHDFIFLDKSSFYTPFDFEELRSYLSYSEIAYEQLFSIYINQFHSALYVDSKSIKIDKYEPMVKNIKRSLLKNLIYKIYDKLNFFKPSVLFLGVGYDVSRIHSLILKSKFKIFLYNLVPFVRKNNHLTKLDIKKREKLSNDEKSFDKFDNFFFATLESFFPTIFLEDYQDARDYYDKQTLLFPKTKYIISESWLSSHSMMFFIAHHHKKYNSKLVTSEHKGVAHSYENNLLADMVAISDFYFTVGWYHHELDDKMKLKKTGLMSSAYAKQNNIQEYKNKILYVTAPAYAKRTNYFGNNFFMGEDSHYFFEFQKSFFTELDDAILNKMIYRMPPILKSFNVAMYNQQDILKNYISLMQQDSGKYSGPDAMASSKLVVINYIGTGYIESIINNIPTIIFLNKNMYLTTYGEDMYKELIEQGIMQSNPKEAARFVMKIEKDPKEWWFSDNIQKARKSFLSKVIGDACVLESEILKLI